MPFLSLVCLIAVAPTAALAGVPKATLSDAWTAVKTPIGITLSCPVDIGKVEVGTDDDPKSTTDSYNPDAWPNSLLYVEREDFPSDEDPKDPLPDRLGGALLSEVDLDKDKVTRIGYGVQEGWPTMDIEGQQEDGSLYWYRISRAKTQHFVVGISGKTLPDRAVVKKILDSYKLPAEIGVGKMTKWWPDGGISDLSDAHLAIWSPTGLKVDKDPDFDIDGGKALSFDGTFGYCAYNVTYEEFPGNIADKIDDDAVDEMLKASFEGYDGGDKIKFGEIKTIQIAELKFRSVTFKDDANDGRIDMLLYQNRLYRFYACGPRGMLNSDDMRKFFKSIDIK